ncbi:MAG: HAMP domain-containing histidine kinase, partial [Bacteroidetes bacterium]|nr:HAMP domain-containing histidine kinase [Bacteroidota bacterium]
MKEKSKTLEELGESSSTPVSADKQLDFVKFHSAIHLITKDLGYETGASYIRNLTRSLALSLAVKCVFISECVGNDTARMSSIWFAGNFGNSVDYKVTNTPCEGVVRGEVCIYPEDLQKLFPNDKELETLNAESYLGVPIKDRYGLVRGVLAIVDDRPMSHQNFRLELLKLFTARIYTELHRASVEAELERKSIELERIQLFIKTVNSATDVPTLLHHALEIVKSMGGVDKATAIVWDEERECFVLTAGTHFIPAEELAITLTREEAHLRYVENTEPIAHNVFFIADARGRCAENKLKSMEIPPSLLSLRITADADIVGYLIFDVHNSRLDKYMSHKNFLNDIREHLIAVFTKIYHIEQLKRLNIKKNEFLGFAAHDLRNPLAGLQGYIGMARLALEQKQDIREVAKDLEKAASIVTQMGELIAELLDISAIESGTMHYSMEYQPLKQLVDDLVEFHGRNARQKDILLLIDPLPSVSLYFDRQRIREVFDNLLSNAIKYTKPGGIVRLHFQWTA